LLVAGAVIALVWANSPVRESYHQLWNGVLGIAVGDWEITKDLRHWVNDGFMALFFLVVGLEIKREITVGELRDPRKLALPAIAAFGGMVVPAAIYLVLSDQSRGWGVTVATDIAFALGVLTLAAARAPRSLRSFLLTLAIVDDIGAILVIALFYSHGVVPEAVLVGGAIVLILAASAVFRVSSTIPYVVLGAALWIALDRSGIHPAITGVVLGLLTPASPVRRSQTAREDARWAVSEAAQRSDPDAGAPYWLYVADTSRNSVSPLRRVERVLHAWTSRLVLPTFALANAGVELDAEAIGAVASPVGRGIVAGLVIGKPLGITGAVWIAKRLGIGRLPDGVTTHMILGAAALAGIGFTVALFITELGFDDAAMTDAAKLAILVASLLAGVVGASILRSANGGDHRRARTCAHSHHGGRTRITVSGEGGDLVRTTDAVFERALGLAAEQRAEGDAVRELLETAMGKRVALVMARQRIKDQADDLGAEVAARAVSLLDATIATGDLAD